MDEQRAAVDELLDACPEGRSRLVRRVLGPLVELPPHERTVLQETLRDWLASGRSLSRAAAALHCHRNTVGQRLRRLERLLDRRLDRTVPLLDLELALRAVMRDEASPPSDHQPHQQCAASTQDRPA